MTMLQVFRSVERWLGARRQEMVDRGEENINIHMERLAINCLEHVRY